ncbi:hypothetical protein SDC9_127912 [bioreactor metagenome]|uniref:Uncharacterized protein n=1 Tax=bioreactor metagenome TaxID=1076179 RepID=A0A645CVC9_9ZZZZ
MLIFIAAITSTLKLSIFNPKVLNRAVLSDEYVNGVYDTILDHFKTLSIPNGIEEDAYRKIITKDIVNADVKAYFNSKLFNRTEYSFSTSTLNIEKNLTNNILQQFKNEGVIITDETEQDIYTFVKTSINQYTSSIKIDYLDYYNQIIDTYKLALVIILAVASVISAVLIVFLFQLNKYPHKTFRYMFFSASSATLMTAVLAIYITASKIFENISITPKYFYNAVVQVLNSYLLLLWLSVILLALLSALMIFLVKISKKRQKKKLEAYLSSPQHFRKHQNRRSSSVNDALDSETPHEISNS